MDQGYSTKLNWCLYRRDICKLDKSGNNYPIADLLFVMLVSRKQTLHRHQSV